MIPTPAGWGNCAPAGHAAASDWLRIFPYPLALHRLFVYIPYEVTLTARIKFN